MKFDSAGQAEVFLSGTKTATLVLLARYQNILSREEPSEPLLPHFE